MIYGFDTADEHAATAALALYVVYRSRDRQRFKVTPEMWGQIERFLMDSAKRARTVYDMMQALKSPRRLYAPTLHPRHLAVGLAGELPVTVIRNEDGSFSHAIQFAPDPDTREFGLQVFERADQRAVIEEAYRRPARTIALVRERLEREKPIEQRLELSEDAA